MGLPWLMSVPVLAMLCAPALATSDYAYTRGEAVVIEGGMAPGGRRSLASHGEGEIGSETFSIYLMDEPAHRRIAMLDGITAEDVLDSSPTAFEAQWAPDARHAAIAFRVVRHVIVTRLYRIEEKRAVRISVPALFKEVSSRDQALPEDEERVSVTRLSWLGPRRFRITEQKLFLASSPNLLRSLGRFGKHTDETDGRGRVVVKFSAVAECELVRGNRYRIVDLKPGSFDD